MTVKDIARRLNISPRTASRLVRQPGFPAICIQRRWVVDEKAFDRWYDRNSGRVVLEPERIERRSGRKTVWQIDYSLLDYKTAKARQAQ